LVDKGRSKIILNLAEVNYIDSSGIRELVSGYATIKDKGGQLKMARLTEKVREMLEITNLYTIFEDYPDEQSAIRSFERKTPS